MSSKKPIHEIRLGRIKAAVWENKAENGIRYNVTITRLYKNGDDEWKDSASFGRDDLPLVDDRRIGRGHVVDRRGLVVVALGRWRALGCALAARGVAIATRCRDERTTDQCGNDDRCPWKSDSGHRYLLARHWRDHSRSAMASSLFGSRRSGSWTVTSWRVPVNTNGAEYRADTAER